MAVTSRGNCVATVGSARGWGPRSWPLPWAFELIGIRDVTYIIIGNVTALSRHWLARKVQLSGVHWHGAKSAVGQSASSSSQSPE